MTISHLTFLTAFSTFAISIGTPQTARAIEFCKVEDDRIVTANGTTIFLDFGVRPSEKHMTTLTQTAALAGQDKETTAADVKDGLTLLSRMSEPLLTQARDKAVWIHNRVTQDGIAWVGAEETEKDMGDATGANRARGFNARQTLLLRYVSGKEAREALIAGECAGVAACEWLFNRKLQQTVPLVPLESTEKTEAKRTVEAEVHTIFESLEAMVAKGKFSRQELDAIHHDYDYLTVANEPPDAQARQKARVRYSNPEISKNLVALYDAVTKMKALDNERDKALAQKVFAQTGNGVLSLSSSRRASIVPKLEEVCRGPENSGASKEMQFQAPQSTRSQRQNGPTPKRRRTVR